MRIDRDEAFRMLREADDIVILTHGKPDGDTIGSSFALLYALEALGKRARVECSDPLPQRYRFLYQDYAPAEFEERFVVAVDVAGPRLLRELEAKYSGKVDLCIDHHHSNELYAAHTLLEADCPAAAQLMYHVVRGLGVAPDKAIADALYTGIVTDTGGFRYSGVTPETHRIAAELIEYGASFAEINRRMFETKSKGRIALEGLLAQMMSFHFDGLCACTVLPAESWKQLSVIDDDLEGISSLPRTVEGVLAGITIFEGKSGNCRVSLRTVSPIDASAIGERFGGGGHRGAAGCTVPGTPDEVQQKLLAVVLEQLEQNRLYRQSLSGGPQIGVAKPKSGDAPCGILLIDKPEGFTSHDVVAKLRGMLGVRRIGHGGTLDPMATGVLPIFVGGATKAVSLLPDNRKRYIATFRLGVATDTQDITGTVLERRPVGVGRAEVEEELRQLRGEGQQIPPMYSAVKVNGRRLYQMAREGVEVERDPRSMVIEEIALLEADEALGEYTIDVLCSAGTYIRTLCHDIGCRLRCGAAMTALRRTMASGFSLEGCITLDEAQALTDAGTLHETFLPVETPFRSLPEVRLDEHQARKLCHGAKFAILPPGEAVGPRYAVSGPGGVFLGVAEVSAPTGKWLSRKLFVEETP